ncbi:MULTISPECIES: hypothetical protein [unclassified Saccharothrix]|uniref:hypothetical protein n=1 Tax=unclassified Saccharothrix TaxID=2593673 RepID=UPI00307E9112
MTPPHAAVVPEQVDFAATRLSGDGADLAAKWTTGRQQVAWGSNEYDSLVAALQGYYFALESAILTDANPLPGRFGDLATAGRTALRSYLDGDAAGAAQFTGPGR